MLYAISTLAIIIEAIFIVIFVCQSFKNKKIISKENMFYFGIVLIITFSLYMVGLYNQTDKPGLAAAIGNSLNGAIKAFTFDFKDEMLEEVLYHNNLYATAFYISNFMAGATFMLPIVIYIFNSVLNHFEYRSLKSNKADIVLGYTENSLKYAQTNPNSILWIDSNETALEKAELEKLSSLKITYVYKPFNQRNLDSFIGKELKNDTVFIIFSKEDKTEYSKYINLFLELECFKKEEKADKTIKIFLEAKDEYISFINTQVSQLIEKSKLNIEFSCFNIYELVSRNFMLNNTLIDHMPKDMMENGLLKNEVNVFFLGFGKINYSIFKSCLLNNHFAYEDDGKLYNKQVNYYLYDSGKTNVFNNQLITRLSLDYYDTKEQIKEKYKYFTENKKNLLNAKIKSIRTEKICNLKYKTINIKSRDFIDEISNIITDDSYNVFFVSFANGVENASFADLLSHQFKNKKIHIYYNVDNNLEILNEQFSDRVSIYGLKDSILKHDVIVNDSISNLAKNIHDNYKLAKGDEEIPWSQLDVFTKSSNLFSALNIGFKLKLLGFNLNEILKLNANEFNEFIKEYNKKYFNGYTEEEIIKLHKSSFTTYEDFSKINIRSIIAFIEHLRWNAFHYINEFDLMELDEIVFKNGKLIKKDLIEKIHTCLTSHQGLDVLHHYCVALFKANDIIKELCDVDVYQYDYNTMDTLSTMLEKIK